MNARHVLWRRTLVRLAALLLAVVLLVPLLPWPRATMFVPAMSPLVALAATLATRTLSTAAILGLAVALVAIARRRWFCRWLCPMGLLAESVGRWSPVSRGKCRRLPPVGKAVVLVSLAAAAFGYPLLLWLDPLAMSSGLFGLGHGPAVPAAWVSAAAVAGVLAVSAILPGAWCRRLCPLGATQDLLAGLGAIGKGVLPARRKHATSNEALGKPLRRRSVLAMASGIVCAGLGACLGWTARAHRGDRPASVLRPPGAAPEWQFPQLCVRCGNCVRACPAGILHPDRNPESVGGWLAPVVVFERDYCREDCVACMAVCPSGAIAARPVEEKGRAAIGVARVDLERCLLAMDRECRATCVEVCPYDAIRLREWTWEDDRRYPIVSDEKCPGCGACVIACRPMDAVTVGW